MIAFAVELDGGHGVAAVAVIAASPPGPARAFEVARWIALAGERVAIVLSPGMADVERAAAAELQAALAADGRHEVHILEVTAENLAELARRAREDGS
jgi:hypothetical protein